MKIPSARIACFLFILPVALAVANTAIADITLSKLFSDHMVIQQNSSVRVWGMADPEEKLTVRFDEQVMSVQANADGQWSTAIKTGPAGGPFELEIASEVNQAKVLISDVMVGEVWICSGQSNMEWSIANSLNPEVETEQAKQYPHIRFFRVEHNSVSAPLNELGKVQPWTCCSPESIKGYSATAYHFAKRLSKDLDVPIGLIQTTWGGTRCEAWTPRDAMENDDRFNPLLEFAAKKDAEGKLASPARPSNLYNGMVSPLVGYSFRGAIWYQGESNVGRGHQYSFLFPTMINSWRARLQRGSFPFYFVQLAPFRYDGRSPEALPEVWDAQLKTLKSVDNVGMAIITDVGNIKDIHPRNKQEVGRRLALWALAHEYQDQIKSPPAVFCGPIYREMEVNGDSIRISFDHVGEGLSVIGGDSLTHFTMCGADQVFYPATAQIDGNAVIVTCDKVSGPVAVRFGWSDTAEPNLFNSAGLPASPFRTDDFELQSTDTHWEDY